MVYCILRMIQNSASSDMYKKILILILLSGTCKGFCADRTDDASIEQQWFQIELLIFANENYNADTEFWPLADNRYPAKMVTVGPEQDEQLKPADLGQLDDIIEYQKIIEASSTDQIDPDSNSKNEFLFDNVKPTDSRRIRSSILDEEDLMSGLNPDSSEFEPTESDLLTETPELSTDISAATQDNDESIAVQLRETIDSKPFLEAYRALSKKTLELQTIRKRLERSTNYRVLYHNGWRQPIINMEQSVPILVQAGDRFDDYYELDGTLTISLARYLHIDTDLWFTTFLPRYSSNQSLADSQRERPVFQSDERKLMSQYPELYRFESRKNSYVPQLTYKLVQSRRMRSSKLHYLDHPAFGMFVIITEVQLAEDSLGE